MQDKTNEGGDLAQRVESGCRAPDSVGHGRRPSAALIDSDEGSSLQPVLHRRDAQRLGRLARHHHNPRAAAADRSAITDLDVARV